MANYYTNFSAVFDVKTPKNARRALEIYIQDCDDDHGDPYEDNFCLEPEGKASTSELWIHADVSGSPDSVADFVIRCAREFGLEGYGHCNGRIHVTSHELTVSVAVP